MGSLNVTHRYKSTTSSAVSKATKKLADKLGEEYGVKIRWNKKGDKACGKKSVASFNWAIVDESDGYVEVEVTASTPFCVPIPSSIDSKVKRYLSSIKPKKR